MFRGEWRDDKIECAARRRQLRPRVALVASGGCARRFIRSGRIQHRFDEAISSFVSELHRIEFLKQPRGGFLSGGDHELRHGGPANGGGAFD